MIYIHFLPIFILSLLSISRFLFFLAEDSVLFSNYMKQWAVRHLGADDSDRLTLGNFNNYMIKPTFNNVTLCIYFSLRFWYILAIAYRKTQPMYDLYALGHWIFL